MNQESFTTRSDGDPGRTRGAEAAANDGGNSRVERRPRAARRSAGPYDELLWRLQARRGEAGQGAATLGLIGCEPRVGATTIAAHLAVRASELGLGPVLLVETHRGGESFSRGWRLSRGAGLAELLAGEASLEECLRDGPVEDMSVLPVGGVKRGEAVTWEKGAMEGLLAESTADHALVIFDLPPATQLRQALMLARRLDQTLLVVRAESTRRGDAAKAVQRLLDDGVPVTGAVLNRQRDYRPRLLRR